MGKGLVHIYCGDGKGKTTAAVGLCVRAVGSGKRVVFAQFLKDGSSSERAQLERLGVVLIPCVPVRKFVFSMNDTEKSQLRGNTFAMWRDAVSRSCDLLVLDELCGAISTGMMDEREVLAFLEDRPENEEVVITGRDPSDALIRAADYVSDISKVKHPFDSGVAARQGIEF